MPRQCIICREPQSTSFSVFSFPSSVHMRNSWIQAIKEVNPDFELEKEDKRLKNGICQNHFLEKEVSDGKKKRVRNRAVPSISLKFTEKKKGSIHLDFNPTSASPIDPNFTNQGLNEVAAHNISAPLNELHDNCILSSSALAEENGIEGKVSCIEFDISENGCWTYSKSNTNIKKSAPLDQKWISVEQVAANPCSLCLKIETCKVYNFSESFLHDFELFLNDLVPNFETSWNKFVTSDYNYICLNCVEMFDDLLKLMKQLDGRLQTLKRLVNCSIFCKQNSKTELNQDYSYIHSEGAARTTEQSKWRQKRQKAKLFSCSECLESFFSLALLSKHIDETHNTPKEENLTYPLKSLAKTIHKCYICSKSFHSLDDLSDHIKSHAAQSDCPVCGRHLTTKARLKSHLYRFHRIGEPIPKPHHCPLCSKKFSTKAGLKYHEQVQHKRDKPQVCKFCNKTFYYNILFKSHMLYSHGEKKIVCEICGMMFFTISKLNIHINAIHRNAKSWTCKQCGEKFNTTWAYKSHISVKHGKIFFSCEHCNAFFTGRTHLTVHLWRHGLYFCLTCNNKFESADLYANHMLSIHQKDISKKLAKSLKLINPHNKVADTYQSKIPEVCKKPNKFKDVLISEDTFNNPSLSSVSMFASKMKNPSNLGRNDLKEKSLNSIEPSQDFASVELNLCILKDDPKLDSHSHDDRIPLEEEVLLNSPMLGDIEDFPLKDEQIESEAVCMNQVFQENLTNESETTKELPSEGFVSSNPISPNEHLSFAELNDLQGSKVDKNIPINSTSTVVVEALAKDDWNLQTHYSSDKEADIEPVIHTLTVDDEVNREDNLSILTKDEKSKKHSLPAFSLDINDRDQVHYKYVMLVNSSNENSN